MDSWPKQPENMAKVSVVGNGIRDKIIKVPLNPKEFYLLKKIDEKRGFGNMAKTFRWLIENYEAIEWVEECVKSFEAWEKEQQRLKELIAAKPK